MRVLEPKQLNERRELRSKTHKKQRRTHAFSWFVGLVAALYIATVLLVPLPALTATTNTINVPATPQTSLPWPTYGQAAVGAVGYGLLDQNGQQIALPMASVAKVMTAVAVLKLKPLQPGESGDQIVITQADVDTYNQYVLEGQSVVEVAAGVNLTQYQALQALLLPSANNMAEILAQWAFGSTADYITFVNQFTKTLGMQNTVIADPSGLNPATKGTAVDLTKLAEIAMNHPIIAEIVGQTQVTLPAAGTVYNVNNFLGMNGIVGIKTGNTDEAGGCFMFAAKRPIASGQTVTVVGVVMGAATRAQAMADSLSLLDVTYAGFSTVQPLQKDQTVGTLTQKNGQKVPLVTLRDVSIVMWAGQTPKIETMVIELGKSITKDTEVGSVLLYNGDMKHQVPIVATGDINDHSVWWRLSHAGGYL